MMYRKETMFLSNPSKKDMMLAFQALTEQVLSLCTLVEEYQNKVNTQLRLYDSVLNALTDVRENQQALERTIFDLQAKIKRLSEV